MCEKDKKSGQRWALRDPTAHQSLLPHRELEKAISFRPCECFSIVLGEQHHGRGMLPVIRCLAPWRSRKKVKAPPRTTSKRLADRKSAKFQKNIHKRGAVPETTAKKGNSYPVGPIVLGFFVFVVIGSAILQIIRTASSGGLA